MRFTILPKVHLSRLSPATKVLVTCFVLSIDAGLYVASLKYTQRAEFSVEGARRYWHGDGHVEAPLLPGEDEIADPGEIAPASQPRQSTRALVDAVHPHLFTVPVLLFVLLHLLSLTRLSEPVKIALDLHGFLAFAATFGLPFWIAADGKGALLFVVAGANLLASFAAASAILLVETWRPPPRTSERATTSA